MMKNIPSDLELARGEAIDFSVDKEYWEKYTFEDETILHVRTIAVKFIKTNLYDETGQPGYTTVSQTLLATYAPKKNKGKANPEPLSPNLKDFNGKPIDFNRIGEERWNVYNLVDGTTIRLKVDITAVYKTDEFTVDGDPYYITNFQTFVKQKVPPNLFRKVAPKAKS